MRTIWRTALLFAILASTASAMFAVAPTSACRFSGPVPTPPATGAQLGPDCIWHLPDGRSIPAIAPEVINVERAGDTVPDASPAADSGDASLPVYVILPLAFIVPLAVLIVGSMIKPKGGGH